MPKKRSTDGTSPRIDEIGHWSEIKLDILKKYASAYTKIIRAGGFKRCVYVDAFAGAGVHLSKETGGAVPGSPMNALAVSPPFTEHHFIDFDGAKVAELRRTCKGRSDVTVREGNCNDVLLEHVLPRCRYKDYVRALWILDPYDLGVGWAVPLAAGQERSIEVFYNFMIMDANRNALWRNREKVPEEQRQRMDFIWGDRSWENAVYRPARQGRLFAAPPEEKQANEAVVTAFEERLRRVAGFGYVAKSLPMKNSQGAVLYYLMFASPNATGAKIVSEIFDDHRSRGG